MPSYEVYLYNLPKVSEDGKELLAPGNNENKSFPARDEATRFAAEKKTSFERAVVVELKDDDGHKLVERYRDGSHELPESIVRH